MSDATPTPTDPREEKLAFIIDITDWPDARNVTFAATPQEACELSAKSAEEAGYTVDRIDFHATRAPQYDRFAKDLPKGRSGWDIAYLEGRLLSSMEQAESTNSKLAGFRDKDAASKALVLASLRMHGFSITGKQQQRRGAVK